MTDVDLFKNVTVAFLQLFNKSLFNSESIQQCSQLNLIHIRAIMVDWDKFDR